MAFNIPLPEAPDVALRQNIGQGANLYNMLVNHAMERAKGRIAEAANARAEKMQPYTIKQMLSQMANASAANARQQALLNPRLESYRLAAEKAKNEANPDYAFNKMTHDYEQLQKYMQSRKSGNQPANEPNNNAALQQKLAQTGMFGLPGQPAAEDRGYSVPSDMPEEQMQGVVPMGQPQAAGADTNPDDELARNFLGAGFKKEYGFNPYEPAKETPQEKREADTQQKIIQEENKARLKDQALRTKTIEAAKADMPHLESTLDALQNMKKIAEKNPDMFGHSGIMGWGSEGAGERYAKTSENPNVGRWQTYGLGPIVAAESKMSSKGNQLALKQSIANKPNFSESQKVALGKLEASIEQIKKSIAENRKLSGEKESKKSATTRVYYNGKSHQIPNEEVEAAIAAGGSLNG